MNNNDKFRLAMRRDPLEAAALALEFSAGCASRANSWAWADEAVKAAAQAGVALDVGSLSWPELDSMTKQLEAAREGAK